MVKRGPETLIDSSTLPAVTLRVSMEKETLEEEKPRAGGFGTPTVFCVWRLLDPSPLFWPFPKPCGSCISSTDPAAEAKPVALGSSVSLRGRWA